MKRVFLLGCSAGALGFMLSVTAVDWLYGQTTQWISRRNENNAATMLIDALTKRELICTSGPLRLAHALIDAKILVLPRFPLQKIIEIEEQSSNVVIHTVSINVHGGSNILKDAAFSVVGNPSWPIPTQSEEEF